MKNRIKHIHFVGIGGSGMCGIAEVLRNEGYIISGSDLSESAAVQHLVSLGVKVFIGHEKQHIDGADVVVASTAVKQDNPEIIAAREQNIPVVPRAQMLAELMRGRQGIAIAGSHGKTTTTSLITSILAEGGLDPTYVIGGRLNSSGSNARLGSGQYIVVEADESDASFLNLLPVMSVITNIDADHMETYGYDIDRLRQAFINFLLRMPFYGVSVLCIDDEGVRAILPKISTATVTYGFSEEAQLRAIDVQPIGAQMQFTVHRNEARKRPDLQVLLNLPGRHNVLNALAAIAIAEELGIDDEAIKRALERFTGVGRRFQRHGDFTVSTGGSFTLIEDYGHHPTEMAATIAAARDAFAGRRLMIAFQPHRYTRTRDCFEDFVEVLGQADAVYLTEVYPAGEAPIVAADGRSLTRALRVAGRVEPVFVSDIANLPEAVKAGVKDQDVVIFMGAGNVGAVAKQLASSFDK